MPQTLDVVLCLLPHVVHELIVRGIHSASELEVLPDQYTQLCIQNTSVSFTYIVGASGDSPSQVS